MQPDCLVSIIVPVYKVEKYIRQCIESIIGQTYTNLEILLVDDGSPDSCGDICDEYAEKDVRIKVIHKKNGGLSDARNAALDVCKGDYLMFVDSDDWVESDYCEKALKAAVENHVSCVVFGVNNIVDETVAFYSKTDNVQLLDSEAVIRMAFMDTFPFEYAWNKIYSRDLFDDLKFPQGYLYEDLAVTYLAFHKAQKILAIPDCTYNYRRSRSGSISEVSQKAHATTDRYRIQKQRIPFLMNYYPNLKSLVYTKVAIEALLGLSFVTDREVAKDMKQFLNENKDVILAANPNYKPFKLYYMGGIVRWLYLRLHPYILRNPVKRAKKV
jgi:glycosyltransferase involved in cell wall biosynthesis